MTWNEVVAKLREYATQIVTKRDNEFARMADSLERHADKINKEHRLIDGGIQMLCQGARLETLSPLAQRSIAAQDVAKLKQERDAYMRVCETVDEYFRDHRAVDLFQDRDFRNDLATVVRTRGRKPAAPPKKPDRQQTKEST